MRLVIVANRLPYSYSGENKKLKFEKSPGGLVSGLMSYLETEKSNKYLWVGWPGMDTKNKTFGNNLQPVILPPEIEKRYYEGFCNKTIWPLFHYFPSFCVYENEYWEAYKKANEIFAETVYKLIIPGDIVLVQDYHLMLFPLILRKKLPRVPIGFFLHIPFPSFEIFRLLPNLWRKEILDGLLGSDLIGFHTYDYSQYFLRCLLRIRGIENTSGQLNIHNRIVRVGTFPFGVNFQSIWKTAQSVENNKEKNKLKETFKDKKIILSVDRLDYTKGIANRLLGFEKFLEENKKWHKKVTLILVAAPSRIGVDEYRINKKSIDELIGRINGKFSTLDWAPVIYFYKHMSSSELISLYTASDIALLTPFRDGMNLIAKEYLASRTDSTGVLILSEMAGAAKELVETLIINPNNKEEIALSIKKALTMPLKKQITINHIMQNRLKKYDIFRFVNDYLFALKAIKQEQKSMETKIIKEENKKQLIDNYKKANNRLIIWDHNGAKPTINLVKIIKKLAGNPKNKVVIISRSDKSLLTRWFSQSGFNLAAEYGAWIKPMFGKWRTIKHLSGSWKTVVFNFLEKYTDRLPGSKVLEKEFSVEWHYDNTDPEIAKEVSQELFEDLAGFTSNMGIHVTSSHRTIEIKNNDVDKKNAVIHFLAEGNYDFILAISGEVTGEEIFSILPESSYTIKIGLSQTRAKFNVQNQKNALLLLGSISKKNGTLQPH